MADYAMVKLQTRDTTYDDDFRFVSDFTRTAPSTAANRIRKCVYLIMTNNGESLEVGDDTSAGDMSTDDIGMVLLCCGVLQRSPRAFVRDMFNVVSIHKRDHSERIRMSATECTMKGVNEVEFDLAIRSCLCSLAICIDERLDSRSRQHELPEMLKIIERLEATINTILGYNYYVEDFKVFKALCFDGKRSLQDIIERLAT